MTRLARRWTHSKVHHDGLIDPMSELRIRTQAGLDAAARARANPDRLEGVLNRQLAYNHAIAVLRMLPPEVVKELFR
jgi:hypothetical protein